MKKLKYTIPLILVINLLIYKPAIAQAKVFIPDANFRSFLNASNLTSTFMDITGDSLIIDSAATFTGGLNCNNLNIADLTGVEYFINITELNCSNNQLTSLPDLSAITTLSTLRCYDNQLASLPNLSANTALSELGCSYNLLDSLPDLSANTVLSELWCYENQLTSLPDLSANKALTKLYCHYNQLTSLPNLSANTELIFLDCSRNQLKSLLNLSTNINLWWLNCNGNQLTSLDVSGCIILQSLLLFNMPTLYEVCVWEIPFPPTGVNIDTTGSPNVYFTTDCTVNISDTYKENNTVNIYPNPNKGFFNIIIDNMQSENIEIKIFNSLGQEIFQEEIKQETGIYTRQINLKEYSAGIYYLQILSVNGVINKQIIIE